jgi:hypothetical protein
MLPWFNNKRNCKINDKRNRNAGCICNELFANSYIYLYCVSFVDRSKMTFTADKAVKTHYLLIINDAANGQYIELAKRYRIPINSPLLMEYAVLFEKDQKTKKQWEQEAQKQLTDEKVQSKYTKKVGEYQPSEIWDRIRLNYPKIADWDICFARLEPYFITDNNFKPFEVKSDELIWLLSLT